MFEHKGNLFVAYGLAKEQEQSLGIMEKIDVKIMNIKDIKQLLFEREDIECGIYCSLYRALNFIISVNIRFH